MCPEWTIGWNGGRAGTRTPDLLRVKNVRGFHDFYVVDCFLWVG